MKKRLSHAGTVVSIGAHHSSPDHIELTVAHGPRKKHKKGQPFPSYDDRPTSRIMLPKGHASDITIGKRVNVGVGHSSTSEPDEDDAAPLRRFQRKLASKSR
jgi:hypothetical protein